MAQSITDYEAFFAGAKQAIEELDELKQREKMLLALEDELELSLETKQKMISDTISQTVKRRGEEINKSYDAEIAKAQERLKKVRARREKAKTQGMKERIQEDTHGLTQENEELKRQMKLLFHSAHVPAFCRSGLYYSMYFTKGIKEMGVVLAALMITLFLIPCGIYFLIPERQTWHLAIIYVAVILIFGGIYMKIGNSTKLKYMETLKEGRAIRNQIHRNKKKMKSITKSIRRDKDEEVYNLQKFDDEIAQLEQNKQQAEQKKKEALHTFENVTKTIISDEIMGNHQAELKQMESDLSKTNADLKETQKAAMKKALYITDNYEVYTGKEFMTIHRLELLEELLKNGRASNITEAIDLLKKKEQREGQTALAKQNPTK